MKVLVLGHTGMLGSMVYQYFTTRCEHVVTLPQGCIFHRNEPHDWFRGLVRSYMNDGYNIINCIGAITKPGYSHVDYYKVNYELPMWLEEASVGLPIDIIYPGTVGDGDSNPYGISKRIASDFIGAFGTKTHIIKSSPIGIETDGKGSHSLLSWVLNSKVDITGYTNVKFNGVTTLVWAEHCLAYLLSDTRPDPSHIPGKTTVLRSSDTLSKYELICTIIDVFDLKINVIPTYIHDTVLVYRSMLRGGIVCGTIKDQLIELKNYGTKK
jgi:dTDP-4-dehydrorhamnose reductase